MPRCALRKTDVGCRSENGFSRPGCETVDKEIRLSPPAANVVPPEILLQIYSMLSPRDFDTARHTCSQWLRVSLDERLLESMLKRAGWWDAWKRDCQTQPSSCQTAGKQSRVWRMSKRFSTECVLSGRKANVERTGFLTTTVFDFSNLSRGESTLDSQGLISQQFSANRNKSEITVASKFTVSNCGNYVLVTLGCTIYVYRLLTRKTGDAMLVSSVDMGDVDLVLVSRIDCPVEVLSAAIDTRTPKLAVAALLSGRVGIICDLDAAGAAENNNSPRPSDERSTPVATGWIPHTMLALARHYFFDVGSAEDQPRSVAIGPGRRCVAFGCGKSIELHWVDQKAKQDCRKHFPMSQPSEILHFLPNKPEHPMELRMISSLAGPGAPGCQCHSLTSGEGPPACRLHLLADVHSSIRGTPGNASNLSLVRATHCHHYRAIPINDGIHVLFVEPRTGLLCIGSDSPIGGPTSLTRALVCAPPFWKDTLEDPKGQAPTVFASGSDLSWGLRIAAAYQDRIVLYSVPVDVFNLIRKERERQGDGMMGDSDLARDLFLDLEAGRTRKRSYSRVETQNGDWEFLLSVSYRPSVMMWPFKIYGKEIGRMDKVVELSVQSSHGGVRVWAFGASGEASIFDVDTYTSTSRCLSEIPCKSLSIGADGSLASARLIDRAELSTVPPKPSRKRKHSAQSSDFSGKYSTSQLYSIMLGGFNSFANNTSSQVASAAATSRRRPSFAACFVDFQISELEAREGRSMESSAA